MQGLSIKNGIEILRDKTYYLDRLERLFFVEPGEIPGQLNKGSMIMDYFWENATTALMSEMLFEIKKLIYTYEKRLIVEAISAALMPLTSGELMLVIEIEVVLENDVEEVLTFTKIRSQED